MLDSVDVVGLSVVLAMVVDPGAIVGETVVLMFSGDAVVSTDISVLVQDTGKEEGQLGSFGWKQADEKVESVQYSPKQVSESVLQ